MAKQIAYAVVTQNSSLSISTRGYKLIKGHPIKVHKLEDIVHFKSSSMFQVIEIYEDVPVTQGQGNGDTKAPQSPQASTNKIQRKGARN